MQQRMTKRMSTKNVIAFFRSKSVATADELAAETHTAILDAIARRRDQGVKRAVDLVSRLYGMKPRRVVQYLRNEVRRPPADEYLRIKEKQRADLLAWAANHDAEAARIRASLSQLGNDNEFRSKNNSGSTADHSSGSGLADRQS
jgi:hypothetical protein